MINVEGFMFWMADCGRRAVRTIGALLGAWVLAMVGTAVVPGAAGAATYAVDACQHPDGVSVGHDGWTPSNAGSYTYYGDSCAGGGGLDTSWDANVAHNGGDYAYWTFTAPAGTSLNSLYSGGRSAAIGPDQDYGSPEAIVQSDVGVLDACAVAYRCTRWSGTAAYGLSGAHTVQFGVTCAGAAGCRAGGATSMSMGRIQVSLNDESNPALTASPSGSLMSSQTTVRNRSLNFSATDTGGGVFRQRLLADGQQVAAGVVDDNAGRCAPYGSAFSFRVPCKTTASGTVNLDTATLSDGSHDLTLEIYDATNSNKVTYGPWTISVDNQPPTVGAVSLSGTPTVGQQLTCSATVTGQSPSTSYAWSRADSDGSNETQIAGATAATYTLQAADQAKKVLCEVTGTDNGGSTSRTSTLTTPPFSNGATVAAAPASTPGAGSSGDCPQAPAGVGKGATEDFDGDAIPNCRDDDDDNDGIKDVDDSDPFNANAKSKAPDPAASTTTSTAGSSAAPPVADNGVNAGQRAMVTATFAASGRTAATVSYGASPTIRGRVVNATNGLPIGGAIVDVLATPAMAGAAARSKTGLKTTQDGRFTLKLPRNASSRTIEIVYRPSLASPSPAGQAAVVLKVRAGLTLRVMRRAGALVFGGRLLGGPFPKPGQLVELQVRKGRSWQSFGRSVRADSQGRFSMTYPTRGVARGVAFTFRALTRATASYPYIGAASRPVRGMVR